MKTIRRLMAALNPFRRRGADMSDHFPAGMEQLCQRAYNKAAQDVAKIIGKTPQRLSGWTVVLVPGEPSPHGPAIRCAASPTGWAGAVTAAARTRVVESRVNLEVLRHEARHVIAGQNGAAGKVGI